MVAAFCADSVPRERPKAIIAGIRLTHERPKAFIAGIQPTQRVPGGNVAGHPTRAGRQSFVGVADVARARRQTVTTIAGHAAVR